MFHRYVYVEPLHLAQRSEGFRLYVRGEPEEIVRVSSGGVSLWYSIGRFWREYRNTCIPFIDALSLEDTPTLSGDLTGIEPLRVFCQTFTVSLPTIGDKNSCKLFILSHETSAYIFPSGVSAVRLSSGVGVCLIVLCALLIPFSEPL
jgi:hypothetical protein